MGHFTGRARPPHAPITIRVSRWKIDRIDRLLFDGDSHRILSFRGADLAFTVVYGAVAWQLLIRVKGQVQLGRPIATFALRSVVCEHARNSSDGDDPIGLGPSHE